MRSRRLWLCVAPTVLCLADCVLTRGTARHPDLLAALAAHPLAPALLTVLWISLFSLLIVFLPLRPAQALALAVSLGHALRAGGLPGPGYVAGGNPILFLLGAALIVITWEKAGAEPEGAAHRRKLVAELGATGAVMRSKKLWLSVPPAVLCLVAAGWTLWLRFPYLGLLPGFLAWGSEFFGEPGQPLYEIVNWALSDPFLCAGATILWISLFSLAVVVLPERLAKSLALALVFVHAAVVAFLLREWEQRLWAFPVLCLTVAALIVLCWQRAGAAGRGRSDAWLRRVAVSLAVVPLLEIAAGLALHVYGAYRFDRAVAEMEAFLGTKLSFDLARLERPLPPDPDNAARWFLAGAAALEASAEESRDLSATQYIPVHAWPPETEARLRELVGSNRRGLAFLHQGAACERSSFGLRYRDGLAMMRPDLTKSLFAARLLSAASRLALTQGDEAGGLHAARTLARLGNGLDEEANVLFLLVAGVTQRSLNRIALEAAASTEPWAASPSLLSGLAAVLPAGDRPAQWQETLLLEALPSSHILRYGWRRKSRWPGDPSPVPWFVFGPLAGANALTESRQAMQRARLPFWRLPEGEKGSPLPSWMLVGYHFAGSSQEVNIGFVFRRQVAASQAQLARAALALRLHGLARGSYPPQRPQWPDLTRKEPLTGRLIAYRLLEDGSLRLEVEGAAELLKRDGLPPDVFRVTLPPPAAPPLTSAGYRTPPKEEGGGKA